MFYENITDEVFIVPNRSLDGTVKILKETDTDLVYPVYGGYMGSGEITNKLSFGLSKMYDSLALEFDTYYTIKELVNKENKKNSYE